MKPLLLFSFSIGLSLSADAQRTGVSSGKITELESNISLPGATVKLLNADHRYTASDQIGSFEFLNVPAGRYQVEVLYIGYQTQRKEFVVEEGKNTTRQTN